MDVKRSESIAALAAALSKAQGEFAAARFDAVNPFLKNRYASLGSIIEAAKPVMAKNGLSVAQPVTSDGTAVSVNTLLMHESGEWIESVMSLPLVEERGKSQAQAAGSVITYLRRYALASVLGMYADADTDGNQEEKKAQPAQPAKIEQAKTPAQLVAELGYSDKPAPLMTLEMAATVKNSDGELYTSLDTATLASMANSLDRVIKAGATKDGPLTPEQIEERKFKRDAAREIIKSRQ